MPSLGAHNGYGCRNSREQRGCNAIGDRSSKAGKEPNELWLSVNAAAFIIYLFPLNRLSLQI
eukprot:IDg17533t1